MNRKIYLPFIIAFFVFLTTWVVYGQEQKNTSERQSWEYKSIVMVRSAKSNADWSDWAEVSGEDVKTLPLPVSVPKRAKELGEQGWELVSVTAISNNAGGTDLAGFTSQLVYWFKRPK